MRDLAEARLLRSARSDEPGARARLWGTVVDDLWSIATALLPERAARAAVSRVRGRFDGVVARASLNRPWREALHAGLWEAIAPQLAETAARRPRFGRSPEQVHRRVLRAVDEAPALHRLIWTFALVGETPAEQMARWSGLDAEQVRIRRGEMAWRVACAMRGGSAEHDTGLTPLVCALFGDLPGPQQHDWMDRVEQDPELRALSTALSSAAEACRAALTRIAPDALGWEAGLREEPPHARIWLALVPLVALVAVGLGVLVAREPPVPGSVPELADGALDRALAGSVRDLPAFQASNDPALLSRHLMARGVQDRLASLGSVRIDELGLVGAAPLPGGGAAWLYRSALGEEVALHTLSARVTLPADVQAVGVGLQLVQRDGLNAVLWSADGAGFVLALRGDPARATDLAQRIVASEAH